MSEKKGPYRRLKYFLGSMIALVILACLAPFFLKGPGDKALLTPDQLKLPDIKLPHGKEKDPRPQAQDQGISSTPKKLVIYRWKGKDGAWHFTDYPNPDGPYEVIYVAPDSTANQEGKTPSKESSSSAPDPPGGLAGDLAFPYKPSNVEQLKQEAERLKMELEKRYEELSELQKAAGAK